MTILYTTVNIPEVKLIDRRRQASDEFRTRNHRAIYLEDVAPRRRGVTTRTRLLGTDGRVFVGMTRSRGELLDSYSATTAPQFNEYNVYSGERGNGYRGSARHLTEIKRVILHQTGNIPIPSNHDFLEDDHRLDVIIAHFVILQSGEVLYTHDAQLILNGTAGLRDSIEIEFHGQFNVRRGGGSTAREHRVSPDQLLAGRNLLKWLLSSSSGMAIETIHPHQQYSPTSRPNCPGPDIWVNVGQWALDEFELTSSDRRGRHISEHMSNLSYIQDI